MTAEPLQPSRPDRLGEALKELRLAAGVPLEAIVEETKVSRRLFEALEAGRYKVLPEKVFCRNFLRQYLRMVGEDNVTPWLDRFDRAWENFQIDSGTYRILDETEDLPPRFNLRRWLPIAASVVVILGLFAVVVFSSRSKVELAPDPRRSAAQRPTPTRSISTPTPFVVDTVAAEPTAAGASTVVEATIRVAENTECWIHYRDRGGITGQELLLGGTVRELELAGPAHLTLGNADAASITIAGHVYSNLGRAGEVAHFEIGAEGLTRLGSASHDG